MGRVCLIVVAVVTVTSGVTAMGKTTHTTVQPTVTVTVIAVVTHHISGVGRGVATGSTPHRTQSEFFREHGDDFLYGLNELGVCVLYG